MTDEPIAEQPEDTTDEPKVRRGGMWWSRSHVVAATVIVLIFSFLIQEVQTSGWPGIIVGPFAAIGLYLAVAVALVGITLAWWRVTESLPSLILIATSLLVCGALAIVGSHNWFVDAGCIGLAAIVILRMPQRWAANELERINFLYSRRSKEARWRKVDSLRNRVWYWTSVQFLTLTWLLMSLADFSTQSSALPVPTRANLATTRSTPARVGVALSGGGYRAALFHAGVLAMLDSLGVPIDVISTVSGGSIIGAYYASGRPPSGFLAAMQSRRFNLKRELLRLDHVVRLIGSMPVPLTPYRVLPLSDYTRTNVEGDMLSRLLRVDPRDSIRLGSWARPHLILCMTEITTGSLVAITDEGLIIQRITPSVQRFHVLNPLAPPEPPAFLPRAHSNILKSTPLPTLIAASGAFPGALAPVQAMEHDWGKSKDPSLYGWLFVDGGVVDNLGLVGLNMASIVASRRDSKHVALKAWLSDLAIVSDGSAIGTPSDRRGLLGSLSGSMDVLYRASAGQGLTPSVPSRPVVLLSPSQILGDISHAAGNFREPGRDSLVSLRLSADSLEPFTTVASLANGSVGSFTPDDLRFVISNSSETHADVDIGLYAVSQIEKGRADSRDREIVESMVRHELARRLYVFVNASTLKDQMSARDAESLFRLGQYVVLLNRATIKAGIGSAERVAPRSN